MSIMLERLCGRLSAGQAALIRAPHHLCYLTGFPSAESFVLAMADKAYFLTDFRYIELAQNTVSGAECVETGRLAETVGELTRRHGVREVFIEAEETAVADAAALTAALPELTWVQDNTLDGWLSEQRAVKTDAEIAKIEQAQALTEAGFDHILPYIREGATEREIALELEFFIRRQGAQRVAFDFIVVAGANGSQPHGIPGENTVKRGDFITMDFGAVVDGYHSDMTRTVALGKVSEEQRRVYDIVLQAQLASLSVLKAGLSCRAGDAAARDIIAAAGYGAQFGHGTGHGVGVQIHEAPNLSPRAPEGKLLVPGNVVTVEPGIYLAGRFGVRIEDMAVITEDGCRDLTHCPKELIEL